MMTLPNGNTVFRSEKNGRYMTSRETHVACTEMEQRQAMQFSATTLQSEEVMMFKSTMAFGGCLYADGAGHVAISDGNPLLEPYFPFIIYKQEDLLKKCWSRMLPKRKPSKLVVEKRSKSKAKQLPNPQAPQTPPSPGLVSAADEIDRALEHNRANSKRPMYN